MSGQSPIEQDPESEDGVQAANPETSTDAEQPLAEKLTKVEKELARMGKMLGSMQGDKDKAAYRAESLSQANAKEIERLGKLFGKSSDEILAAQRQAVLEDVVSERLNGNQNAQATAVSTPETVDTSAELTKIDQALGLPQNDPRVTQLKIKYGSNPMQYLTQAATLKATLTQPETSPAEQPLPISSVTTKKTDVNVLINELNAWQKNPSMYRQQIKDRTAELDARGWK